MTDLNAPTATITLLPVKTSLPLRALKWLAEIDKRYRDIAKLRSLPSERLIDMGIIR